MKEFIIDINRKVIIFKFPYDNELTRVIKSCGYGVRFDKEDKYWIVPVNTYTIPKIKDIIIKYDFKEGVLQKHPLQRFDYSIPEIEKQELKQWYEAQDFAYEQRDYQLESLYYALDKVSFVNGDDTGVGKTWESILYTEYTQAFPCLVISPASVKYNWAEKWAEATKGRRSPSVIETKNQNWDNDIVVINYDIIGKKQGTGATVKFEELLKIKWEMIIFDEFHFCKSSKSQRSKAAKKIAKNVKRIQGLSGTMIMSRPDELWYPLTIIRKEDLIARHWKHYAERYCDGHKTKYGFDTSGATNIFELNNKLRENCYIRREKREVLTELPETIKQKIYVPITNSKDIKFATEDFIQFVLEARGEDAAEKALSAQHLVSLSTLRKLAIEGKMKAIIQYLKDWKESGEKLVVFGIHREPLIELSEKFKCPLISGGVTAKKKRQIVKDWQTSEDVFLFANIESAGTGTDGLQEVSSNELILEIPWRPSDLEQVIGRVERSGQKESININFLLNMETIDKEMWEMIADKEYVTEAVNKGIDIREEKSGMLYVVEKILERQK